MVIYFEDIGVSRVLRCLFITFLFLAFSCSLCSAYCQYGEEGEEVAAVQLQLYRIGQMVDITGVFDDQTVDALLLYQHCHFLPESGTLDEPTVTLMFGQPEIPLDISEGHGLEWIPVLILKTAERYIGIPYVWGGASPEEGFDCSGFVQYVFRQLCVDIPRTADEQFNWGYPVEKSRLLPGDLVFFETYEPGPSHIGIYYNAHYFIHADSGSGMVMFDTLDRAYREETYLGARRMYLW